MLDSKQPKANSKMKMWPRRSSAYMVIMNVSDRTPYAVSKDAQSRIIRCAAASRSSAIWMPWLHPRTQNVRTANHT